MAYIREAREAKVWKNNKINFISLVFSISSYILCSLVDVVYFVVEVFTPTAVIFKVGNTDGLHKKLDKSIFHAAFDVHSCIKQVKATPRATLGWRSKFLSNKFQLHYVPLDWNLLAFAWNSSGLH